MSNYRQLIKESLERDLLFQFTTQGPHKDDLEFILNGSNKKIWEPRATKIFINIP